MNKYAKHIPKLEELAERAYAIENGKAGGLSPVNQAELQLLIAQTLVAILKELKRLNAKS